MNRILLTLIICLVGVGNIIAQNISAQTMEEDKTTPLGFVNVALYEGDINGKLIKGVTSDLDGYFTLDKVEKGKYTLVLSYVGYKTIELPVVLTAKKPSVNLGKISMTEDSQLLEGVEVRGQKSQMRFDIDKKVFDVTQSIVSEGASASDALSNIPSVSVDNEGNISLRNNSSVTVWINGRPSGLSEDNRAQILEQLPAESIETIEIITNPSSRYSAEGSAGIINIVMKKEKKAGYYGGVSANGDTFGGYGASANINVNYNNIQAYASLGYRSFAFDMTDETRREAQRGDDLSIIDKNSNTDMRGGGLNARAGLTWYATKKDQFNFSGSIMDGTRKSNKDLYTDFLTNDVLDRSQVRKSRDRFDMNSYNAAIDYRHEFDKTSNLFMVASFDYFKRNKTTKYDQYDTFPETTDNLEQLQVGPGWTKELEFQIDYTKKWNDFIRLEAGYKGNIRYSQTDMTVWDSFDKDPSTVVANLSNDFGYDDQIHALYLSLGGKWDKLSYQVGVRSEYTYYTTSSQAYDDPKIQNHDKGYTRFFPSAFLSYAMENDQELQLNYTSRIRRPSGRLLNPFYQLSDSTNISFGNPFLEPEYTTSLEFNYIKNWGNHTLSTSLYYKENDNVRERVSYMIDDIVYTTYENITDSRRAGVELVSKNRLWNVLDLTTTVNMYYFKLDGFEYQNGDSPLLKYGSEQNFSWDARMIASVMLPWKLSLQVTGNYQSAQDEPQQYQESTYWLDAGLRRSFLDRKLSVSLSCRDLLNSRKRVSTTFGNGFTQKSISQWGGRSARLSVSWTFGNSGPKRSKPSSKPDNGGEMGDDMLDF